MKFSTWAFGLVKNCMRNCSTTTKPRIPPHTTRCFAQDHASADWRMVRQVVTRLEQSLDKAAERDIKRMLAELVPQYKDGDTLDIVKVA